MTKQTEVGIQNYQDFQIPAAEITEEQSDILVKFAQAFDLTFSIRGLTEPWQNRQNLRLPSGEDAVLVHFHQMWQER